MAQEFDKMYVAFDEWKKTQEAFVCVQASDFAQVWMTAYRAGEKSEREACANVCDELDRQYVAFASSAAECATLIRQRSNGGDPALELTVRKGK